MILKKFNDNYDAEFVNLMLDVQNLIQDFCKSDKLKINSWAKILCVPTVNIEFKKNRNLYAIKLLDNVLNGKLEDPFDKFARDRELTKLNPILVRTQLTPKFFNLIKKYESFDYENYLSYNNCNDYNNYKKEKAVNKFNKQNSQKNIFHKNNPKLKNKIIYFDYDNQFLLFPINQHKRNKSTYKISNKNNNCDFNLNKKELMPSDILLITNFGNLPYKNSINTNLMELRNLRNNKYEKNKLKSIVNSLNEQRIENIGIILNQKKEIDDLKKKISSIQFKIKKVYNHPK